LIASPLKPDLRVKLVTPGPGKIAACFRASVRDGSFLECLSFGCGIEVVDARLRVVYTTRVSA